MKPPTEITKAMLINDYVISINLFFILQDLSNTQKTILFLKIVFDYLRGEGDVIAFVFSVPKVPI